MDPSIRLPGDGNAEDVNDGGDTFLDDLPPQSAPAVGQTQQQQQQQQQQIPARPRQPAQVDAYSVWNSVGDFDYEAENHYFGDDISVVSSRPPQPLASTAWLNQSPSTLGGTIESRQNNDHSSSDDHHHHHHQLQSSNDSGKDAGGDGGTVTEGFIDETGDEGNGAEHSNTTKGLFGGLGPMLRGLSIPGFNGNGNISTNTTVSNNGKATDNGENAILDVNGNSLPHPDEMRSTNVATLKVDHVLDGNGNSLPHPETLMRNSTATSTTSVSAGTVTDKGSNNSDAVLDVNGNSLPHPDEMRSTNIATLKEDQDLDILSGYGNSLPHPEALMRNTTSSSISADADVNVDPGNDKGINNSDAVLDVNGNSLPHPDEMMSTNVASSKEDQGLDILSGDGNSLPHPETLMRNTTTSMASADANADHSNDLGDNNSDAVLDVNGNSLPHPDEMMSTNVASSKEDQGLDILSGNGNSLPHPETLMRNTTTSMLSASADANPGNDQGSNNNDAVLDVNGNSLPHPDEMMSTNVASSKADQDLDILRGGGNSLPHPETLMRNTTTSMVSASADTNPGNDQGSNNNDAVLDVNGNSLPHPDEMMSTNVASSKADQDLDILSGGGNSLPHPETLMRNTTTSMVSASDDTNPGNDQGSNNNDAVLDVNGNSLPHPDEMMSTNVASSKEDQDLDILSGGGNSLPHPETLMRHFKGTSTAASNNDFSDTLGNGNNGTLDDNGNSLPHPDAMRSFHVANINESTGALDENGNSLPHPETLMGSSNVNILEELEETVGGTDSESTDDIDDDSSSYSEDLLDDNGNSLPHPETMLASAAAPRTITASSLFGNFRRSLMSSIPGMRNRSGIEIETATSYDGEDFRDEENAAIDMEADSSVNTTMSTATLVQSNDNANLSPRSSRSSASTSRKSVFSIIDDDIDSDPIEDLLTLDDNRNFLPTPTETTNSRSLGRPSAVPLDENESSSPSPEESFRAGESRNNLSSRWRSTALSFWSTFRSRAPSVSHPNATSLNEDQLNLEVDPFTDTPYNGDEECGRNAGIHHSYRTVGDNVNGVPVAYEVENFNDENSSLNRSNKESIQNLLRERNIDWRWSCLLFAIFLIFLGMLIPLITLSVERRKGNPVETFPPIATVAPTTTPTSKPIFDPFCNDEIILVDEDGKDLADENTGSNILSGDGYAAVCYTTKQPIRYRFKRCNPLQLDWIGIFPSGSLFMDKLWKRFYAGTYLCDGQPCPTEAGNDIITKESIAPPITDPGEYRFFLVKSSDWPYEYAAYASSIRVVENEQECQIPSQDETDPPTVAVSDPKDDDFGDQVGDLIGALTGDEEFGDQVGDIIGDTVDSIGDTVDSIGDTVDSIVDAVDSIGL